MEGLASWTRPQVEGKLDHRKGTTLTIVQRECFLWGGRTEEGVSDEMYTLKLEAEKLQWVKREQNGDKPSARECHTTTYIGDNKLLVFGGQQYDEVLKVFNDVYIFDTASNTWEKPEIDGKPPPARARHTATYSPEKNCLYVFGGYRKTTRRMNDIFELNLDTWVWSQPNSTGAPPSPRYGHEAVLLGDKLMILGGLGGDITNTTLADVGFLDLNTMEWEDTEHRLPHAVAMLSAVAMESAGYKKVFIFGGQTGSIMDYTNDVHHLSTNTMEWTETGMQQSGPEIEPPPCADCAIAYDPVLKHILAFGGAGNELLDGLYVLDVRPVVGPEYAMFELNPPLGPLHGGMACTITGQDFFLGSDIKVQLTDGRRETQVPGTFESPTEIKFITPDLSMFGDKVQELNVRVSMEEDEYTVNLVTMKIFLDTKASNSLAYGPGLLKEAACGLETSFMIWAKNLAGQERTHGGDDFQVRVKLLPPPEEEEQVEEDEATESKKLLKDLDKAEAEKKASTTELIKSRSTPRKGIESDEESEESQPAPDMEEIDDGSTSIDIQIIDHNDGSYEVLYNPEQEGTYEVSIAFDNAPIPGSPFRVEAKEELAETQVTGHHGKSNFFPVMSKHVPERIQELEDDFRLYESTLAMKVGDRVHTLLKVMSCIEEIQSRRQALDLELAQLKETAQYMVKNKGSEDHRKNVNRITKSWEKVKQTAPQVDKDLVVHKNKAKVDVKKKIESFNGKINRFERSLAKNSYYLFDTPLEESYFEIDHIRAEIASHETALEELEHLAMLFNFTQLLSPSVEKCKEHRTELLHIKNMWDMYDLVEDQLAEWRSVKWTEVQSDVMELRIKEILKSIRQLDRRVKQTDAFAGILNVAKSFQASVPLIVNLRHPSMRDRHWKQLMETTDTHFVIDENFVLADLLALNLPQYEALVDQIVDRALKEEKMEKALAKLNEVWDQVEFTYTDLPEQKLKLIKITEDDFEQLENDQLVVQSMMGSKYLSTFEEEVVGWRKGLIGVERVMTIWGEIQRTWAYLVTLFIGSEEVKRDLPEDSKRFAEVDGKVREFLSSVVSESNALNVCNRDGLYEDLVEWRKALEECEKSLMDYLDSKRVAFPRFYFVSTTDLLDILCNGNDPAKIMVHMNKVILGIADLELDEANFPPSALSMTAAVGVETVKFSRPLQLNGKVENYLQDVIQSMRSSLRDLMGQAIAAYGQKARDQWLLDWPAQLMLTASQVHWTTEVNSALQAAGRGNKDAMKTYFEKQKTQLNQLIEIVTGDLSKPVRQKVMTLITLDTHARDIVDKLIQEEADSVDAFAWTSQLRYSWDTQEKDCFLNICDASFRYGYEYLGNGPRLVITPLTDRIYITATQSLHLRLGCAPAGPAGTGKTETTKDLASSLGKPCYVFNCSDQMDYKGMGNIFKGLAASGSWGCFDEFNRLVPAVLSVCSVQFKAVVDAVRHGSENFTVEGATLKLDPTVGVFITMNPGYLGRAELPETLKTLFRPITVMKPDLGLICENMLMAEGFKDAKILARKFTNLYQLLADLLSKQSHYDWGLRAIKSVLVVAGSFKRAEPEVPEMNLLMRALRDSNLAKIPTDDVPVFQGLISDLFPGVEIPRKRDAELEAAIEEVCTDPAQWPELKGRCLTPEPTFVLKVVQLYELMSIRHCVFAIGGAGSGKSSVWKTLARAQSKVGPNVLIRDLNPKAITPNELYGYVELSTREWKDGLLSNIMRELSTMPDKDPKWIILDGDLDANWIESMNSVMDDNKILTLASNERIPLLPHMRMIFEIRDLNFATPATVSRAGILYISEGEQWDSYAQSWINSLDRSDSVKELLREFFARYVPTTLQELRLNYKHSVPMTNFNMVYTICNLMSGLLDPENKAMPEDPSPLTLETYFVFAAVWGFGSALIRKDNIDYRKQFSEWWKFNFKQIKFSPRDSVFDVFVDPETEKFVQWRSVVPESDFDSQQHQMNSITIPIAETTSINYFASKLMSHGYPIMLVGGSGVGKTAVVRGMLKSLDEGTYTYVTTNLNYYSDSALLQRTMEAPLEKKAGRNYGPPGTKRLVYFVDDLNMPVLDPYNTQGPIALLRQHMDYGHWYDRDKLSHRDIKNVSGCQYICAMNPTAGSFTINPRLQRHFAVFALDLPSPGSLMDIYRTFLAGHLAYFEPDVTEQLTKIVHAALLLHSKVSESFKKTAVNFHYEFTMRHLANVFQGLLMADPGQFKGDSAPIKFVELWLHESERVYCDRLVTPADIIQYKKVAKEVNSKFFASYNLSHLFEEKAQKPLVFAHFAHGTGEKIYDKVPTIPALQKILQECLNEYNEEHVQMNLLLFEDAVKHVARISRIIESPAGHALLVGVGGSGKQSLSRLAAYAAGFSVFQITISSNYGMNDLKEDLKSMFMRAGLKNESLMFLLTESQVTQEKFLVYINDLLSSADIPGLLNIEDIDNIVNSIRIQVKQAGLDDTRDNCIEFFRERVRANLHVVLCFSPVGENFRSRMRRFPALVNCTVIDWFQPWPESALLGVARKFLQEVDLGSDEARTGIENFMPFSFGVVNEVSEKYRVQERRYNYTTPKSYLELINLYKLMLDKKRTYLHDAIERLETGLDKLHKTSQEVDVLSESLRVKSVEVEEKKLAAEVFAEQVGKEKAIVEAETAKANTEEEACAIIQADVSKQREQCEAQLTQAEPLVVRAMAALDTLNKKDLGEMKALKNPPTGVDDVLIAVMVMLSKDKKGPPKGKNRTWTAAVNIVGQTNKFIETLKNFKDEITEENVPHVNFKEVRPYLKLEYFNGTDMSVKSKAAAGLCEWVINIVKYYDIICLVNPMRRALATAESELEAATTKLAEVRAQVAELEEQLSVVLAEFEEADKQKQAMIAEMEASQAKLDLAQRLVSALESENVRWQEGIKELRAEQGVVVGDALLAASFVSYIGGFSKKFRDELLNDHWIPFLRENNVPLSEKMDPLAILTNDSQIATWQNQGLPADRVSVENGCIVSNCERWPLIIDPQLQGITWIKEKEAQNDLQVVRLGQKTMLRTMEMAIQEGKPVLIENLGESIDAVLMGVVGRQVTKKLGVEYFTLGDKEVELNRDFRLYLHTKLGSPHYPPEIQAETTLINFAVTQDGLEDQLLAVVVGKERPDLEEQKLALIKQQNDFKIKLKELEDDLLERLATAEGDLTEDVPLIENLEESKRVATEIGAKVVIANETERRINIAREMYRPAAERGSLLFFLLNDLNRINSFYQFSLKSFIQVFVYGIETADPETIPKGRVKVEKPEKSNDDDGEGQEGVVPDDDDDDDDYDPDVPEVTQEEMNAMVQVRLVSLIENTSYSVFGYTRRGLFEKHKLIVATQLTLSILERRGEIDQEELTYLMIGKTLPVGKPDRERLQRFINENAWGALHALNKLPKFSKIVDEVSKYADLWDKWCADENPETMPLPKAPGDKSPPRTSFQKLLVIRALRPDRLAQAMTNFVRENLGDRYVEQGPFDVDATYAESNKATPIFFILFPGAQPVKDIEALAETQNMADRFVHISMGQGQEPVAEKWLDEFGKEGGWVFLDNVHLMQAWLPTLERKLEILADEGHEDFRCYYSAEPHPNPLEKTVPESILKVSIKVVNEPPQDLKANLRRAFANFDDAKFERSSRPKEYKQCLFSLCFFHALVLGRRKFGPQGWSKTYSFNVGDLTICADVLHNYISNSSVVPWEDMRYMFGQIMYGGHITDRWDRRTCRTYLAELFQPSTFEQGGELAPDFVCPPTGDRESFQTWIEDKLPRETPAMFGLHANAEIDFLTAQGDLLFKTIIDVKGAGGVGGAGSREAMVLKLLSDLLERLPADFDLAEITSRITEKTPFIVVMLQECTRMNRLLSVIRKSLEELQLGLTGALNITDAMEALNLSLFVDRVPEPWAQNAYPSLKSLGPWFADLLERVKQLRAWSSTLETPISVWIAALFNPMAFLTAVMQTTAREQNLPLDSMIVLSSITAWSSPEDLKKPPEKGRYIHGLSLQGARWDTDEEALADSLSKELFYRMPVLHITAGLEADLPTEGVYECPVYITPQRGPTYVTSFTIPSSEPANKWILAGVALLMAEN
eukprot:TRINITY_DN2925_c0_g1_i1.p1 TRINITY_DN2925_c0_g1~~TRINITY_DN2925_c0_g1_i1.p1  ORF type:complete len:4072 (-),score=1488.94 TRINITY_DN2925_c0_g1_i1:296-12511(-)